MITQIHVSVLSCQHRILSDKLHWISCSIGIRRHKGMEFAIIRLALVHKAGHSRSLLANAPTMYIRSFLSVFVLACSVGGTLAGLSDTVVRFIALM
jgi:hypothetical protein